MLFRSLTDAGRLVLVVIGAADAHEVDLAVVTYGPTTNLEYLAFSTSAAFLNNGPAVIFSANLQFDGVEILDAAGEGFGGTAAGDIQIKGSYPAAANSPLLKATVLGTLNDSTGDNAGDGDATLKGTITPAGRELPINNIIWPE